MPSDYRNAPTVDRLPETVEMKSTLLSVLLLSSAVNHAAADEWGCEVLLCAALSDPSWHDIAECRPPMSRLISAMKRPGFSWPTCPEGGAGKPGFEKFEDCPSGWSPAAGGFMSGHHPGELSQCIRKGSDCWEGRIVGETRGGRLSSVERGDVTRVYHSRWRCDYVDYMARPRREKPYYFDIVDDGNASSRRVYFDLN